MGLPIIMDREFAQTSQIPTLALEHIVAMEVVVGHELSLSFVRVYTLPLEVQVKETPYVISCSVISSPHAPIILI